MIKRKNILTALLSLVLIFTMGFSAFAAEPAGTENNPYLGGHAFNSADDNYVAVRKLDIAAFEKAKAAELIASGNLSTSGTVTYFGNAPVGTRLEDTDVVGYYTTSDDAVTKHDVTLAQLTALDNIKFRIEQVELGTGNTPGSTNPNDYVQVSGGIDSYALTRNGGQIGWTRLPNGTYRVTEILGTTGQPVGATSYIVSLPMVNPTDPTQISNTVYLYPKNRAVGKPTIEKVKPTVVDYNGNVLSWTIKSEIPTTLKSFNNAQEYIITDTMSGGIKYSGNLKVYYLAEGNTRVLVAGIDYVAAAQPGATSISIALTQTGINKLAAALSTIDTDTNGRRILYVTYETVVSLTQTEFENAITPTNNVTLDFTNSDGTYYYDATPPITLEHMAALKVIKKDAVDQAVLLPNAKFKVYTKLNAGGTAVDTTSVLKDAEGNELVFTTDANGEFFYAGLGLGGYFIVETDAPTGYKTLNGYTAVEILGSDVINNNTIEATIVNYKDNGLTLPNTGGIGTVVFTFVGLGLITIAGIILMLGKKRSKDNA